MSLLSGKVVHAQPNRPVTNGCIAICKNAGVEFHAVLETINKGPSRGAIICETGGKLAHLAVVGREYDVTILLVPNALKLYNENQYLTVDLINDQITLIM